MAFIWIRMCYRIFFVNKKLIALTLLLALVFLGVLRPVQKTPLTQGNKKARRGRPHEASPAIRKLQKLHPNLPIAFWHANVGLAVNKTCAKFPNIFDLEFNNDYWQTLRTSNGTFQLYGAYLDVRRRIRTGPVVRILGMIDRIEPEIQAHCQLWFDDGYDEGRPIVRKVARYKFIWNKHWGNYRQGVYQPYLIDCLLPEAANGGKRPRAVSVVEKPCDLSTNALTVTFNKVVEKKKKDFAVCVKGLDLLHVDFSVRLIEWIELLRLLGNDKVFFYKMNTHPNITKVLEHYQNQGNVEVAPISLAGSQPNAPFLQHFYLNQMVACKRQNEVICYNDCFYRHMYDYNYIALLDVDEVIMPVKYKSWKELLRKVVAKARKKRGGKRAAYHVRNAYFLDDFPIAKQFVDVPKRMHMLQHLQRTRNFTRSGHFSKAFFDTENVVAVHNHWPMECFGGRCFCYEVETSDALLQHYRSSCRPEDNCKQLRQELVLDASIWRFREPLISRVNATLTALGDVLT